MSICRVAITNTSGKSKRDILQLAAKAAEIIGLYMAPPENGIVLPIDKSPSIQALERAQGVGPPLQRRRHVEFLDFQLNKVVANHTGP